MQDYDVKVEALYEIQSHRCAITGRPLMAGQKWDLHHAGVADSKRKEVLRKYRELLHSLLNLQLVEHGAHITQPMPRHWPLHIADKLERRLREDKGLCDLMNCRSVPDLVHEDPVVAREYWRNVADTREYLLREAGAVDTTQQDRIVGLMLAKRVPA